MGKSTGIEWRPIAGHPGYRVSNAGDVESAWKRTGYGRGKGSGMVITDNWKRLKANVNANGYQTVNLGRGKTKTVHSLVLSAFVGPRPSGHECRHLNGDRTDNRVENLRWGTPTENHRDQYGHGTRESGERHHWHKLTTLQVHAIRDLWQSGRWLQGDIADLFGVQQSTVSSIVNLNHRVTDLKEAI